MRNGLKVGGMALLMGGSGVLHFAMPGPYRGIVPHPLAEWKAEIVAASGVAELVCAALLLHPRTRPLGACATAALLVAVFPANVQAALDGGGSMPPPLDNAAAAWLRLPVQPLLVAWALGLRGGTRVAQGAA